jgi:hypothetical protein
MAEKRKGKLFGKPREEVVKRPGAFSKKAEQAGMSTSEFASHVMANKDKFKKDTILQANLAQVFSGMRRKKKKKKN